MRERGKNVVWLGTLADRALLISINGEWDLSVAGQLEDVFERIGTGRDVVLDLRGVSFMDSTVLGKIIRLHRRLADAGRRLDTISAGVIKRLFTILSLDKLMGVSRHRQQWIDENRRRSFVKRPVGWQS